MTRVPLAIVVSAALLVPRPAAADTIKVFGRQAVERFRAGLQALQQNDLDGAESAFAASLSRDPNVVGALLGLAQVAFRRGQAETGRSYLEKASRVAPDSAEVHLAWGRFHYWQRDYAAARHAFEAAIRSAPDRAAGYVDLGDLYVNAMGRPADAIPQYRRAVALEPSHAGAHYALGIALMKTGDAAAAERSLLESARLAPRMPLPLQALAQLYERRGERQKAREMVDRVLSLAPEFAPARVASAELLDEDPGGAARVREYRALLDRDPGNVETWIRLGATHQEHGRLEEAATAYRRALALEPNAVVALNNLAWLRAAGGGAGEAVRLATRAAKLAPDMPAVHDTLGWAYLQQGKASAALPALERAASLAPSAGGVLYRLALCQSRLGHPDLARATLARALALTEAFAERGDAGKLADGLRQAGH